MSQDNSKKTITEKEITNQQKDDLAEIIKKQQAEIEELKKSGQKQPQIIIPGVPKAETFKGGYRNGWRSGELKKLIVQNRDKKRAEMRGDRTGKYIPSDMNITR